MSSHLILLVITMISRLVLSQSVIVSPSLTTVSTATTYAFTVTFDNYINPVVGSALTITFPSDFQGKLGAGTYSCVVGYWPNNNPVPDPISCTLTNLVLTISGLFPAVYTYPPGDPFYF